ncbi:hypothetical protein LAZ67_2002992 [Cordylochernes scorpioides]|uniref:Peptidase A2 domain-containing protein n=1 Tax=Cordylochernes scorpioides TaxID=51811 RepID=A0ABY6K452_9ARAC|nr:hypothetical protein LAZ67_2002992 [Cordylochernes scorpioides]
MTWKTLQVELVEACNFCLVTAACRLEDGCVLDDLKIELENVETQSKGYLKVQLDNINKIKENIEHYMIELVDSDEHESHMPIYKEANKDITEIQSTLLNYLELKENINTKIEETKINLSLSFLYPLLKLGTCQEFAKLSLDDWIKFVRSRNLCINCLGVNHYANHCKITVTCKVCNRKHHTTLHHYNYRRRQGPISTTEHQANTSEEQNHHQTVNHTVLSNNTSILETNIFLSTVLIKVFNPNNDELMCRALIDSGAQKSLITETLADKLNIAQEHTKVKIAGFNSTIESQVNKIIKIKLSSIYDNFKFETKALIVKDLSYKIPNFYTHNPIWPHLNNLKLADPEFYIPRPIDIIIGADLYLDILLNQV